MASRGKKKKLSQMEVEDSLNLSRKKWDHTMSPKLFIILKLLVAILIPIMYFIYSPFLVVLMIVYVSLFFLAILAERRLNKSVIKKNHIKIPKFDSALALIVICIAFAGSISTVSSKSSGGMFANLSEDQISTFVSEKDFSGARQSNWWASVSTYFTNFGSLLTGERSVFSSDSGFSFGMGEPPEGFVSEGEALPTNITQPTGERVEMSMEDIPLEYMFSTILSTVDSALIFLVSGVGILSVIYIVVKRNKFENEMTEVLIDNTDQSFTEEEINRLLSFGEDEERADLTSSEIDEKIQQDKNDQQEEYKNIEIVEAKTEPTKEEDILIFGENYDLNKVENKNIGEKE